MQVGRRELHFGQDTPERRAWWVNYPSNFEKLASMGEPTRQCVQIGKATGLVQWGLHHRILRRNCCQLLVLNRWHELRPGRGIGQNIR